MSRCAICDEILEVVNLDTKLRIEDCPQCSAVVFDAIADFDTNEVLIDIETEEYEEADELTVP